MEKIILFIVSFIVCVWEVNPMALQGPILTKYDPCGLGVIHFYRLRDNYWQGVIHFGLYNNLLEAEMLLIFENEVTVAQERHASDVTAKRTNKVDLILNSMQPIPTQYTFFVSIDNLQANQSDVPNVILLTLNNVPLCNAQIKASQTVNSLNLSNLYPTNRYAQVCGRKSINHTELVSLRTEAAAGDWPWHVAIFVKGMDGVLKYECGGNVISRTAIVTAGHCVHKNGLPVSPNQVQVVVGINNYKDFNQIGRQLLTPTEIVIHPSYLNDEATADLAIIKVQNIDYTEFVQPICLWGPVYDKISLIGKEAVIVGFGATESGKQSDVLRSTYTKIQNDSACIEFSPDLYTKLLNEFTFCVGYGPTSSINPRNGDSGGGLVLPMIQADHKISWLLRGVLSKCGTSPGNNQCDPKYFVVYTDVAPHYGWIYHHAGLKYRSNVESV